MPKFTVRHAVLQYASKNTLGQDTYETAFRNMSVELEDGPETDRLLKLGAIVPDGEELARPGRMLGLPETATDAEILNWVAGATTTEVAELVAARPATAPRLLAAQETVQARFDAQAELLGAALKQESQASPDFLGSGDNSGGLAPAPQPSTTEDPAVNSPGEILNPAAAGAFTIPSDSGDLSPEEADKVVAGGARAVADYISEHPQHSQSILQAESRREDGARPTVVKAVQAAAAFGSGTQ